MHIYFVRHGETEFNRRGRHQPLNMPLSPRGRRQVEKTAERLKGIPVSLLLSSDLPRANESAHIIGDAIGLPVDTSELFREVTRPSNLYGKKHLSITTLTTGIAILYHLNDPAWHFKDEENLFDIKARVERAVDSLRALEGEHEHVVVVSHAFIINLFIKYMCAYKRVRRRDYLGTFIAAKRFRNASITTISFNDDHNPNTCDWLCHSIDDVAHLTA